MEFSLIEMTYKCYNVFNFDLVAGQFANKQIGDMLGFSQTDYLR